MPFSDGVHLDGVQLCMQLFTASARSPILISPALTKLLSQQLPPTLADLLASAEVMKSRAVNADVVTMYSRVEVVDAHTRRRQVLNDLLPGRRRARGRLHLGALASWYQPSGPEDRRHRQVAHPHRRRVRSRNRCHPVSARGCRRLRPVAPRPPGRIHGSRRSRTYQHRNPVAACRALEGRR